MVIEGGKLYQERSFEGRESYFKIAKGLGVFGMASMLSSTAVMMKEAVNVDLSKPEHIFGTVVVMGGAFLVSNVMVAFNNAAQWPHGPLSGVLNHMKMNIIPAAIFTASATAACGTLPHLVQQDVKDSNAHFANLPVLDPNTPVAGEVSSAQQKFCNDFNIGRKTEVRYQGRNWALQC